MATSTTDNAEVERVPDFPGSRPGYKFVLCAVAFLTLILGYVVMH